MSSPFREQFASLIGSGSPPPSIFVHSPSGSPSLSDAVLSVLHAHTAHRPLTGSTPTVADLLPKVARLDLEQIHSTKQLFDQLVNQLVAWKHLWSDAEMGVANWDEARGFKGLKVVKSKRSKRNAAADRASDNRQTKRQRMMDDEQQQSEDGPEYPNESELGPGDDHWSLEWNLSAAVPPPSTKLAPIRNTLEAFHHSLRAIYDFSAASASPSDGGVQDDFDFQPGISLSLHPKSASSTTHARRYVMLEHGELLGDLASGAGGGGSLSGAAKETGIGMTFTSTLHRLSQLSELPITVIVLSKLPYRKSRETLVGLPSPYLLEYSEPTLENALPLLHSRFTSSATFSKPRPETSRLSPQDLSMLFKTLLQLLAMTLHSAIGNDLDQLSWWTCKLWPKCLEVVEGSNPPIPPERLDRLKIALQPQLNTALSQLGQPRTSLSNQAFSDSAHAASRPELGERASSDSVVRHGFTGVIRDLPKAPTYLAPVNDSPTKSALFASSSSATSTSFQLEPPPLRPFPLTSTPSSSSLVLNSPISTTTTLGDASSSSSSSSLTKSLPTVSRFVLVAAYFAAHNPPKSDVRMFVRVDDTEGGVARKGKRAKRGSKKIQAGVSPKKKRGNLAAFMTGGKPFAYERLIAIFESIVDEQREFAIGTISVHTSIQTLISLRLLLKASGEKSDKGALDGVRLKCPLSRDEVEALAKGVGWPEWKERLVDVDD